MVVRVRWVTGFLDSPSRVAEPFWEAVTGWGLSPRRDGGTFATLVPPEGDACLRVQVTGDGSVGAHLDLHVKGFAGVEVCRSPAGIVFCLVGWDGEAVRPGPSAHGSVVDQLCLDIPEAVFERECEFWSRVTGWAVRATDRPEFRFLERPAGMGIRLLLQRVGGERAGVHVDFAAGDVDAEVGRHVGLGAVVVREVPGEWTTLRDPVGREYCVTARSPHSS